MILRVLVCAALALGCGCARTPVERLEWTTMGTVAAVQTRGSAPEESALAVRTVKEAFTRVEKLLNAHNPDSELSRLAPLPESEVLARCDAEMRPCYDAAFRLAHETGGAFNPRWRGTNTLDLGGIAKGFALDLAAARLVELPLKGDVLLDLGGNLRVVRGDWETGVLGADGSRVVCTIRLRPGESLATSAEYFRGKHIYDGRTRAPVANGVSAVTVRATSAMAADGLSTAVFVLGPEEGRKLVSRSYAKVVRAVRVWLSDGREISF